MQWTWSGEETIKSYKGTKKAQENGSAIVGNVSRIGVAKHAQSDKPITIVEELGSTRETQQQPGKS